MSDKRKYDILGFGAITVDLIGRIDHWPSAGEKVHMSDFIISDGGLVATATVAAARMGGDVAMAGKLGYSVMAERAYHNLEREGIDLSYLIREENCEPVLAMVLVQEENGERNIFFSRKGVDYPFPDEFKDDEWLNNTKVLLIDHGSGEAGLKMAELASENNIQIVLDAERMEPHLEKTLEFCDHIVVSRNFASMYTGYDELKKMLYSMRKDPDQDIIITLGDQGCAGLSGKELFHIPGHTTDIMDSTGSGDVFHGAYALSIARGMSIEEAARYANAAAALSTKGIGGRGAIPGHEEVINLVEYEGM